MRKRKATFGALIAGISLIVVSLGGVILFQIGMNVVTKNNIAVVSQIEDILPERTSGIPENYVNTYMPSLEIAGRDYSAILEIPSLSVKIAVEDEWNGNSLFCLPSRFSGSPYDNSLVIGGADHKGQFSFCNVIEYGTVVTVTDMTGARFDYRVTAVDRAKRAENEWLTSEEYDLTLFCRDTYAMEYIAVRCNFEYNKK